MKYQIALVDDNIDDLNKIYNIVKTYFSNAHIETEIEKFNESCSFDMQKYYSLLFLDIEMPHQTGFELAKKYVNLHKKTLIVFVTDHKELVYSACNIHPFDFVRKENLSLELPYVLKEALFKLNDTFPTVSFQSNGNTYILNKEDIIFCESFNHNTVIHYNNSTLNIYLQLHATIKKINLDYFIRVSRSYYVNMKKVIKLEGTTLYLENNHVIQISRQKKSMITDYLKEGGIFDV